MMEECEHSRTPVVTYLSSVSGLWLGSIKGVPGWSYRNAAAYGPPDPVDSLMTVPSNVREIIAAC